MMNDYVRAGASAVVIALGLSSRGYANGACCLIDGSCASLSQSACASSAGSFQGELSSCAVIVCPLPGAVLSEQKISATSGGFGGTLELGDVLGTAVAAIGDLDGDGVNDLAVGSNLDDDGGVGDSQRGAVWILFLNADGTVESEQKISATSGGFGGTLDPQDRFGRSVTALGDLDGDGVTDLAVGATGDDDGGGGVNPDRGAVWIVFLNADGTVKDEQKISATSGGFVGPIDTIDAFGTAVATVGDLDGDGVVDLAVGAVGDDDGGGGGNPERGAVWILFLNTDGTVASEQKISAASGGFGGTLSPGDWFGTTIASIGDLDGDGIEDIAVGSQYDDDGGTATGAVWILFLEANGTVASEQEINDFDLTGGPLDSQDNFGAAVTAIGDVNGDGVTDLAVGTIRDDDGANAAGAVWIVCLGADGTVRGERKISATSGGFGGALDDNDQFGSAVAGLGDLDGDGRLDLAATAPGDDDGADAAGAVWMLSLAGAGDVVFVPVEEIAAGPGNHEATGDFDEDGDADVVIVIPTLNQAQVFLNDGTNLAGEWLGLTALAPIAVGSNPNAVAVGLLDDDVHLDLAIANTNDDDVRILLGAGTGAFAFDVDIPVGNAPRAVAVADLKGDAQVDLAVANTDDDTVTVYRNVTPLTGERSGSGEGSGLVTGWLLSITIATGDQPVSLEPEDVDNDKDLDLVIVNKGGGTATIALLQSGALQSTQTVAVGNGPTDVALGDLDGDGDLDLATANSEAGTISLIENTGVVPLGPAIFTPAEAEIVGANPASIDMADLDGDGDLDLAVVADDLLVGPAVQVLENHTVAGGDFVLSPPVSFAIQADPNYVVAVDLDGDGVSDLVTVNSDDTPGGGSVTGLITYTCTGDINGDGLVGFADVTQLLLAWGPCPADPAPCPFDIDNNGAVGFADLTLLLLGWGDCT